MEDDDSILFGFLSGFLSTVAGDCDYLRLERSGDLLTINLDGVEQSFSRAEIKKGMENSLDLDLCK